MSDIDQNIIKTENLGIGYRRYEVARGINVGLPERRVTALIGRNGAGKSTLLKTLSGLLAPLKGEVKIDGKNLEGITRKKLAHKIAVVTSDSTMADGLTVRELVGLGRIPYTGRFGRLTSEDEQIVEESIRMVGIGSKRKTFVGELSDGERQKAMIARGLAQGAPIMMMDEPFSFLDVSSRLEILDLLLRIAEDDGKTILFSTHEVTQALRMVENVWMFVKNESTETVISGTPEILIENGYVDRLFDSRRVTYDRGIKDFVIRKGKD